MSDGDDSSGSRDDADSFLRAVAASPPKSPQETPTRIAHFRILGELGRGGMGVVYRAEDESLRRTVALKLLPSASGDPERRLRFLREARSAAAISHPNVAVVYQVGEADGRVYIAMELVEGESLAASSVATVSSPPEASASASVRPSVRPLPWRPPQQGAAPPATPHPTTFAPVSP